MRVGRQRQRASQPPLNRTSGASQVGHWRRLLVAVQPGIAVQPRPELQNHSKRAESHRGEVVGRAAVHGRRAPATDPQPAPLPELLSAKTTRHVAMRVPLCPRPLAIVLKAPVRPLPIEPSPDEKPAMDEVGQLLGRIRPSHASRDRPVRQGTPVLDRVCSQRAGIAGSDIRSPRAATPDSSTRSWPHDTPPHDPASSLPTSPGTAGASISATT